MIEREWPNSKGNYPSDDCFGEEEAGPAEKQETLADLAQDSVKRPGYFPSSQSGMDKREYVEVTSPHSA